MKENLERMAVRVSEAVSELPLGFERGLELEEGADGTPTTNIDKLAEDLIIKYVENEDVQLNILSEEVGYLDRGFDRTLVIDPIDGTNNAILGIPFFSVSLAVGNDSLSNVEMGLVRNLVNDDIYFARRGEGAYVNGNPLRTRSYRPERSVFLVYMGKYAHEDTFQVAQKAERTRSIGCASLEMAMVAEGIADIYYMNCAEFEKSIRVVDIAASALILREAGGELLAINGEALDMPFNLNVRRNFVAVGDPEACEAIL